MTPAPRTPAPTVNRAPEMVIVRAVSGRLLTRISTEAAYALLEGGHADPVGRDRIRYIRLHKDVHLERGPRGWWIVEESRRVHGDAATLRSIRATEHPKLKVERPEVRP